MAGYAYDEAHALLVVVRGDDGDDAEYEEFLRRVDQLDHDAFARKIEPAFILVTSRDTPAPNAHWRRRIAEAASESASANMFAGVVTDSAVQRGVINALRWLQSKPKGTSQAFATFDAASAAAEEHRGQPLPALRRLLSVAQEDLAQRKAPRSRQAL